MHKLLLLILIILSACQRHKPSGEVALMEQTLIPPKEDGVQVPQIDSTGLIIETGNTTPQQVVSFARTLIGTPYLFGSSNPKKGFDCSGFITYVFNHFNITVPRSSIDFTDVQHEVPLDSARQGDLILFTGTDSTLPEVGHMGIVMSGGKEKSFIHSTSGKAYGVTITPLNEYYMGRFVKVIRIFNNRPQ